MDGWRQIWNKEEIILESLIKADGFDSGAGNFTVDDWITYVNELYGRLGILKNNSFYDVGCGSGAFVYPLYLKKIRNNQQGGGGLLHGFD